MPFQTSLRSMKWYSAVLKWRNIGKNLYYKVHLGTICSCSPILLTLLYRAKDTYQQSAGYATQFKPLPKPLRLISQLNTSCLLQSKSQWLAEIKQEHSREVPAKESQTVKLSHGGHLLWLFHNNYCSQKLFCLCLSITTVELSRNKARPIFIPNHENLFAEISNSTMSWYTRYLSHC